LLLSLLLYLFLDLGFGGLFLIKRKGANMSKKEMQRMIEESNQCCSYARKTNGRHKKTNANTSSINQ
jgi:hypothetical protein